MLQLQLQNPENIKTRQRALADPYILTKEILGYRDLIDRLHGTWGKRVQEMVRFPLKQNYRVLCLAARGLFKSTFWSVGVPIWALANDPNLSIGVVNEVEDNAINFVKEQEGHIQKNGLFIHHFGDWFRRGEFSDQQYIVKQRTTLLGKEPSMYAAGIDKALVSTHFDIMVLDDIAGPDDRDSPAKRKRTIKFYQDMFSLLKDVSVLIVVGTPWHQQDVYHHIQYVQNKELKAKGLPSFDVFFHPSTLDGETPTYPEIVNAAKLMERRINKGIIEFSAQDMLNPRSEEQMVFQKLHFFDINEVSDEDPRYGYADYAGTKKENKGDFSAIISAVYSPKDQSILVVDADVRRRPVSQTNYAILLKHAVHAFQQFGVEDDTFSMISEDLRRQSMELHLHLSPFRRPVSTLDNKIARINRMEGKISTGMIKFRKDWRTAPNNYYLLIEQLQTFGNKGENDDAPDALEGLQDRMTRGVKDFRFGSIEKQAADQEKLELEQKRQEGEKFTRSIYEQHGGNGKRRNGNGQKGKKD